MDSHHIPYEIDVGKLNNFWVGREAWECVGNKYETIPNDRVVVLFWHKKRRFRKPQWTAQALITDGKTSRARKTSHTWPVTSREKSLLAGMEWARSAGVYGEQFVNLSKFVRIISDTEQAERDHYDKLRAEIMAELEANTMGAST